MSDLTSLRAIIKSRIHQNSGWVDAAIADAFRFVRNEELSFNASQTTIDTVADQIAYPLPDDFLSVRGRIYYTPANSDQTGRYPLKATTLDDVETFRYTDDWEGDEIVGTARKVAIDFAGKQLYLAPTPSDDGDEVFFRYTRDLGTPVYTATTTSSAPPSLSSTVTLLGPDGQTLPSTFTNEWFKQGFQLLTAKAVQILWSQYHGGTEEAQLQAQNAQLAYLEELLRLRGESASKTNHLEIRRHI